MKSKVGDGGPSAKALKEANSTEIPNAAPTANIMPTPKSPGPSPRKKVLLIQSSPYAGDGPDKKPIKKSRLYFVGLGLPLLAALTPEDWEVEIILETIEEIPWDTDAALIGIGSMGHAVVRTLDIARQFRARGKTVVLGGYMVSLMPEEAGKHADAVVLGDAEATWPQVIRDFEAGCLKPLYKAGNPKKVFCDVPIPTPLANNSTTGDRDSLAGDRGLLVGDRDLPENLYHTPLPRFDLIVNKRIGDFLPVQAGRGCPNTCSFCSVYCLYRGRYLKLPLEEVLRDVKQVQDLGFKKFLLLDDNIGADRQYLLALCEALRPLGMQWLSQCDISVGRDPVLLDAMAGAGCIALSFGLESLSEESLHGMDKDWAVPADYPALLAAVRRAGIDLSTEMVVGGEGDTLDSIKATARFIEENRIVVPRFYILTPIPGTDYFEEMQRAGRIVNADIYAYNGSEAVHQPAHMSPEDLTAAYWALYEAVFSIGSIVRRSLLRREAFKSPGALARALFYLGVNLYYRRQIRQRITPNII
ncbi:B12-binding domain-containing radical SAM protein [Acidaminobacter hydrogenoformans]|uniref:Radical SAM superfamily enzyme YgiQ, UPF0313 family n=1 Tax=Acidaminobacter hydrogenoformans DSM 2784 TaxID=1120920 RepID=A0A1G5RZ19_9FIRM|nr:radical SAM protein [Acidaminobacter hydrogenoformans]SCZ79000.1 Radical SAM superfamily enzyme YgiQ, UPF0313 family [Acidaminobacter hydrogenoformans DSM 2784]